MGALAPTRNWFAHRCITVSLSTWSMMIIIHLHLSQLILYWQAMLVVNYLIFPIHCSPPIFGHYTFALLDQNPEINPTFSKSLSTYTLSLAYKLPLVWPPKTWPSDLGENLLYWVLQGSSHSFHSMVLADHSVFCCSLGPCMESICQNHCSMDMSYQAQCLPIIL